MIRRHAAFDPEVASKVCGTVIEPFLLSLAKTSNLVTLRHCNQIHAKLIASQCISQTHLTNNLLSLYAKFGHFRHAHLLFDQMPQRNVFTWTTLISSHFRTGSLPKAFEMFNHICALNERPNEYTFSVLLRACATPSLWNVGLQIHGLLVRSGLERNKFSGSSIVYMYFNSGSNLGDACCAFHDLLERDLVAWNVMISGFARVGDFSMVHRLFSEMWGVEGLKPDDCTFVSLLKCCSSLKELKQIHGLASKFGAEVDVVVGNALVDLYGKHGDVSSCRKVFDSKKEKYNFVWSLIISGYSMNKGSSSAWPNDKIWASKPFFVASVLFTLCASVGELVDVEKLFRRIDDKDIVTWNSMILAHARLTQGSGSSMKLLQELHGTTSLQIQGASLVAVLKFCENKSDLPDDGSWSSIIGNYRQNGMEPKALELCKNMFADGITFTGYSLPLSISACSQLSAIHVGKQLHVFAIKSGYNHDVHSGYVEDTMHFFTLILNKYKIKPESEHYSCLVDAYGRAGRLEEAYQTVQKDGNESAWRTLLSACRNHNNKEIGEKCAMKMIELNSSDHAGYILLSGIYIGEGKWEEALKCRERMAKIHVKKDPGSSWLI
ncbi:Pentatricopeptide repeat-containing protein [Glycine max]|nr:Pentatricopeptide repeat-containing protein [Glycine max]